MLIVFNNLLLYYIIIRKFLLLFVIKCSRGRHETVLSFNWDKYLIELLCNHWAMGNIFIGTLGVIFIFLYHLLNNWLGWIWFNYLKIPIYLLVLEIIDVIWEWFSLSEIEFLIKSIWNNGGTYYDLRHALYLSELIFKS